VGGEIRWRNCGVTEDRSLNATDAACRQSVGRPGWLTAPSPHSTRSLTTRADTEQSRSERAHLVALDTARCLYVFISLRRELGD